MSLSNLAISRADVGQREEAVAPAEEAVALYRPLAKASPAAYADALAGTLDTLANRWAEVGRREEALPPAEEAVRIRRELAGRYPAAYSRRLASSLHNLAVRYTDAGRRDDAAAQALEAVTIYRRLAMANPAAHNPWLARCLHNASARLGDAGRLDEAMASAVEAVAIDRRLAEASLALFEPELARSLNNLAVRQTEAGQHGDAVASAEEAVALCRGLAERNPAAWEPDLALSLNNLAYQLTAVGRLDEAAARWRESALLRAGLREQGRAVRHLIDIAPACRPPGTREMLVAVLAELRDTAMVEILRVRTAGDRRRLASDTAWLASAAAVFLAVEADRPADAIEWLDAVLAVEARLVGVVRDPEFGRLRRERPELADRLHRAVSGLAALADPAADRPLAGDLAAAEPAGAPAETLAEVVAAIQRSPGFGRFAAPRTLAEIAGGLAGRPAAWVVFGPHGGAVVTLGADGEASSVTIASAVGDLQNALAATLADRPADAAYLSLRAFALPHVVAHLPTADGEVPPVVVPVGLAAWLPLQSRAEAAGAAIEMRPLLERSKPRPPSPTARRPLVAHSHGRPGVDPRLAAALEEARAVAKVLRTRARVDPGVSPELVLARLGRAPLVHLACHGAFSADPQASLLRLGSGALTVQDLVLRLSAVATPPVFVALNACESARSEVAAPEQSLGFPSVFISHGVRAVLATLWPVDDPRAKDIAESFYRNWASGMTAGQAFTATMATFRSKLPLSTTVDAFCLYGDRDLAFPCELHVNDIARQRATAPAPAG